MKKWNSVFRLNSIIFKERNLDYYWLKKREKGWLKY